MSNLNNEVNLLESIEGIDIKKGDVFTKNSYNNEKNIKFCGYVPLVQHLKMQDLK